MAASKVEVGGGMFNKLTLTHLVLHIEMYSLRDEVLDDVTVPLAGGPGNSAVPLVVDKTEVGAPVGQTFHDFQPKREICKNMLLLLLD